MRISSEKGLIDTNVLVYAHDALSPFHKKAKELRDKAGRREIRACVSHQNLLEFYAVITNPKKLRAPLTPQQALREIKLYASSKGIDTIHPKSNTLKTTLELLNQFRIKRDRIFDVYLLATMIDNSVRAIYTEDTSAFEKYELVDVVNPFTD